MKLKRLLVLFCMIVSCVCLSVAFAACGETAHTHLDAQWSADATNHWKVCPDCGETYDQAAHSFSDGKCTVCGREQSGGEENPGGSTGSSDLDPIEGDPNCDHQWAGEGTGWTTAKDKTCEEDGVQTRTCTICGRRETRPIKSTGHIIVKRAGNPPTCTEPGYEDYEMCTQCDYTTMKEEPALGHDFVDHEGQAASCTETGWTAYKTCSRCDYDSREDASAPDDHYIDLLPHKYPSEDADAQCEMCHKTRFIASEGLEIEVSGSIARVVGIGTCEDEIVAIPEEYDGRPVTDISESAFSVNKPADYYNTWDELTKKEFDRKVDLLNQVTEIKMRGIKLIGASAFFGMQALTTIDLGSSLQRIGTMAFSSCNALTEITIPKTCTAIEEDAFLRTDYLREIKVEDGSPTFTAYDNHYLVRNGTGELVYASLMIDEDTREEKIEIPEQVKIIGFHAFAFHFSLKGEVVIPGTVTRIGSNAFQSCTQITKVTIEAGVTAIEKDAFMSCVAITEVVIDTKEVTVTDEMGNEVTRSSFHSIEAGCFAGCASLTSITFLGTGEQWEEVQKVGSELVNGAIPYEGGSRILIEIYCDDGTTYKERADGSGFYNTDN